MAPRERRAEDKGPEARRLISPQTIGQILLYLFAGGTVGGGIAFLSPTNAQLGVRVDQVESNVVQTKSKLEQVEGHVDDYIRAHSREETLKDHLFQEKLNRLDDKLDRIESDIKEIKGYLRNGSP